MSLLGRVLEEPPFRLLSYSVVKRLVRSVRTIDKWGAVARPHYFAGVLAAADQAKREGVARFAAIEFGVAGGNGLVELQDYSAAIGQQTGTTIDVFGFDTGEGLPELCNDFRDHPDVWRASDYRMDVERLKRRLTGRTALRLGNIKNTVPQFVAEYDAPVGFISFDADLYSSTVDALRVLSLPGKRMLRRSFLYFDDVEYAFNHRFAGELLAIDEFNVSNEFVKIDRWRGVRNGRVFSDQHWFAKMYVAHDLDAINLSLLKRPPAEFLGLLGA